MIVGIVFIAMVIGMAVCGDADGTCERLHLALNIAGAMGVVLGLVGLAAVFILA